MFLTRIARCRSVLFLLHDARFCWRFVLFIRIYVCFPIFAHVICSMYSYLLIDVWRKILCSGTKTFQAPGLDWRTSPECRGRWQWLESWSSLDHHTMRYCDTMVVQYVQLRLVSLVACCVFRILVPRQWIIGSRGPSGDRWSAVYDTVVFKWTRCMNWIDLNCTIMAECFFTAACHRISN